MKIRKLMTRLSLTAVVTLAIGCSNVRYTKGPDGTEEFVYKRVGSQKLQGFTAEKGAEGMKIGLKSSEGTAGELGEALNNAAKTLNSMAKTLEKMPIP